MLLVTERGHAYTAVEDFDDPEVVWLRSQDRQSIRYASAVMQSLIPIPNEKADYTVIENKDWDYQFRIKLTKGLLGVFLRHEAEAIEAHKLKPAVAEARGHDHPISHAVFDFFMQLSRNRPDGSVPGWLRP